MQLRVAQAQMGYKPGNVGERRKRGGQLPGGLCNPFTSGPPNSSKDNTF